MPSIAAATVRPARRVKGRVQVAGDKSISHRYALLAALADGRSTIGGYSSGADCAATLECLRNAGVDVRARRAPDDAITVEIGGRGLRGLKPPASVLDAQNSGTTMRLLSGVLAAHPFTSTIKGDPSLTRRPMRRIIEPLEQMGARIESRDALPPLTLVARRRSDETVYVYADPAICHCEYVGSAEQYAEYRRQRNAAVTAATAREALAAEERIETYDEGPAAWASPWLW